MSHSVLFFGRPQALSAWLMAGLAGLSLMVSMDAAWAQAPVQPPATVSPQTQYLIDSKNAQTRYDSDKLLCNDETTSQSRLQCRRDAKADFDKALAEAKAQRTAASTPKPPEPSKPACADCGKVASVSMTEKEGEGSPLGLIAGGAAGALLGRQIGSGTGKNLATIAGAVGGAYAGKKIEEKVKTHKVWTVGVHYPDGSNKNFDFDKDPGLKVGDTVKNADQSVVRY